MEGILLPVCSLFFSGLLLYVYFSKDRVNLLENKMYSWMIMCSFVDSLLVCILQSIAFFYQPGFLDFIISLFSKRFNILFVVLSIDFIFLVFYWISCYDFNKL